MPFVINEAFRRNATKSKDNVTYERGWIVWKESAGIRVASEAHEIFSAMASTVKIGDAYPALGGLKCVDIDVDCRDDCEIWDVTARYEIPAVEETPDSFEDFLNQSNGSGADDPSNPFGPEFSGGGQVIEEYRIKDLDGRKFVNSANRPYTNLIPIAVTIQIDRVTVSERQKPDTSKQGRASGKKLLASVTYQSAEHVNKSTGVRTRYYKNTYEVWTHPTEDWAFVEALDAGFEELIRDGNKKTWKTIVDKDTKEPLQTESPLNGGGRLLPAGSDPITTKFRIRKEGPLGVPFLAL